MIDNGKPCLCVLAESKVGPNSTYRECSRQYRSLHCIALHCIALHYTIRLGSPVSTTVVSEFANCRALKTLLSMSCAASSIMMKSKKPAVTPTPYNGLEASLSGAQTTMDLGLRVSERRRQQESSNIRCRNDDTFLTQFFQWRNIEARTLFINVTVLLGDFRYQMQLAAKRHQAEHVMPSYNAGSMYTFQKLIGSTMERERQRERECVCVFYMVVDRSDSMCMQTTNPNSNPNQPV
jgi:hypothetical protein